MGGHSLAPPALTDTHPQGPVPGASQLGSRAQTSSLRPPPLNGLHCPMSDATKGYGPQG